MPGESSFNFNNKTDKLFNNYKGKIYFDDKGNKNLKKIVNIFNSNGDNYLESNEVKNIWSKIKKAALPGNSFVFTEKEATDFINRDDKLKASGVKPKDLITFINAIDKSINKVHTNNNSQNNVWNKFSIPNLRKNYPEDKYNVKTEYCSSDTYTDIIDKKTGKKILSVSFMSDLMKPNKMSLMLQTYDSAGKSYCKIYDKKGELTAFDGKDGKRHYPISDKIYSDITAKTSLGFPTTGKNLEKHIMQINKNNVFDILGAYISLDKQHLDQALMKENMVKNDPKLQQRLISHLNKCIEQACDYNPNYTNNHSQVSNKYYKGDIFKVKTDRNGITVINTKTSKVSKINYSTLFDDNFPIEKQVKLKKVLQRAPGEVLEDFSIECTKIMNMNELENKGYSNVGAQYNTSKFEDYIAVENADSITLIHELGHAIDFSGKIYNSSKAKSDDRFCDTMKKELNSYIKSGHRAFKSGDFNNTNYATTNEYEMFAECYTLLTSGHCISKGTLEKYFPNTLKEAARVLSEIRKMPNSKRH